jgi:hypothetical protein
MLTVLLEGAAAGLAELMLLLVVARLAEEYTTKYMCSVHTAANDLKQTCH